VAEVATGDVLLGLGIRHETGATFFLSGLSGDLTSLAVVHLAYGIGSRALFEVKGASWQVLSIDAATGETPVNLDPGVEDGVTADAGDFELALSFLPIGRVQGFSAGGHIVVKLPNSDEGRGIGSNTTDVTIAGLFSGGGARWRATGWMGVGILEAPVQPFVQNDVFAYAFEWLWRANRRLRLGVSVLGRASTRGRVPLGTEDRGELRVSGEWRLGQAAVDLALARGYTGMSGDWSLQAGLAWTLARGGEGEHPASER